MNQTKKKGPNSSWLAGRDLQMYGIVEVGNGTIIGDFCVLGYPKEARIRSHQSARGIQVASMSLPNDSQKHTVIGSNCQISSRVTIHEGSKIDDQTFIDDGCRIGFDCEIGRGVRVEYASFICDRIQIGNNCVIGGFIGDGSVIGNGCIIMGKLIHELANPEFTWETTIEPAPVIKDKVVIGFNSVIVGGVTIGANSYIAASSIVTRDIPPDSFVFETNRIIPISRWKKINKLAKSVIKK